MHVITSYLLLRNFLLPDSTSEQVCLQSALAMLSYLSSMEKQKNYSLILDESTRTTYVVPHENPSAQSDTEIEIASKA